MSDIIQTFLAQQLGSSGGTELGSKDSGIMTPDDMMRSKAVSDPTNIITDSGSISPDQSNPFLDAIAKSRAGGPGVLRQMLDSVIGGRREKDKGGLVPNTGNPRNEELLSPVPSRDQPQSNLQPSTKTGLLEQGNIDLNNRPVVQNNDGSISTVHSKSFNIDGREVLLPTISDDGRHLTDTETINQYRNTGRHLGIFGDVKSASQYAEKLHQDQEKQYRYAMPQALDPNAIEELRRSLLTDAGQMDPNNPNGLSGRMNSPNAAVDQRTQMNEAQQQTDNLRGFDGARAQRMKMGRNQ